MSAAYPFALPLAAAAAPAVGAPGFFFRLLVLILLGLLIDSVYLWIGAKLAAGRPTNFTQAVKAAVWIAVVQLVILVACSALFVAGTVSSLVAVLLFLVLALLTPVWVTARSFRVGLFRGFLIMLAPFLFVVIIGLLLGLLGPLFRRVQEETRRGEPAPRHRVVEVRRGEPAPRHRVVEARAAGRTAGVWSGQHVR